MLSYWLATQSRLDRCNYPYFTGEKTEAQRGKGTVQVMAGVVLWSAASGPFGCAEVHECLGLGEEVKGLAVSRFDQDLTGPLPRPTPIPVACSLLDRALHSYPIDLLAQFLLA